MTFENFCQEAAQARAAARGQIFHSRLPLPLSHPLSPLFPPLHELEESERGREGERERTSPAEEEASEARKDATGAHAKAERVTERELREKAQVGRCKVGLFCSLLGLFVASTLG